MHDFLIDFFYKYDIFSKVAGNGHFLFCLERRCFLACGAAQFVIAARLFNEFNFPVRRLGGLAIYYHLHSFSKWAHARFIFCGFRMFSTTTKKNGRQGKPQKEFAPLATKEQLKSFVDRAIVIIEPAVVGLGLELVTAQCSIEGGRPVLRLFIDRLAEAGADGRVPLASSVSLDDCAAASKAVDAVLEADTGEQPAGYVLEVSSPGLNRPLIKAADFYRFTGHIAKIKLRVDGKTSVLNGRLASPADGSLALETVDGLMAFKYEQVVSARLSLDGVLTK